MTNENRGRPTRREIVRGLGLSLGLGGVAWADGRRRAAGAPRDAGRRAAGADAPVTRFIALGDTGEGNVAQFQVAAAMGIVSAKLGTDFALLLGDNFYDTGVDGPNDAQFVTKFEQPYGPLGFPFRPILGNHDYGGGMPFDWSKGDHQVTHSALDPRWDMPARHYRFGTETAHFIGLDTTRILVDDDADQRADVPAWMGEAGERWKIVFGHHTYVSNGPHGDAGNYDGLPSVPGLEIPSGQHLKDFFDDVVVGQADLYVCGNDHNLQHALGVGGTSFVVSGAGSKTAAFTSDGPAHFNGRIEGFFHFEVRPHTLILRAYDSQARLLHYRLLHR